MDQSPWVGGVFNFNTNTHTYAHYMLTGRNTANYITGEPATSSKPSTWEAGTSHVSHAWYGWGEVTRSVIILPQVELVGKNLECFGPQVKLENMNSTPITAITSIKEQSRKKKNAKTCRLSKSDWATCDLQSPSSQSSSVAFQRVACAALRHSEQLSLRLQQKLQ